MKITAALGVHVYHKGDPADRSDNFWSSDYGPTGKLRVFVRCYRCKKLYDIGDFGFSYVATDKDIYGYGMHCIQCVCGIHFHLAFEDWEKPPLEVRKVMTLVRRAMKDDLRYIYYVPQTHMINETMVVYTIHSVLGQVAKGSDYCGYVNSTAVGRSLSMREIMKPVLREMKGAIKREVEHKKAALARAISGVAHAQ